jgi:ABC-type multidrug transport system ATPase subunit
MALLEITAASKRFGATTAVDDVSLSVERGAFYALLGRRDAARRHCCG